jgi:NADPH:quinone reductase-like Zn-dependent oxidoreductase
MTAIAISAAGPPDVLRPVSLPTPRPGPGPILLKVAAAA